MDYRWFTATWLVLMGTNFIFEPDTGGGKILHLERVLIISKAVRLLAFTINGEIILNPPANTQISNGDELIIFAEDDSTIHYFDEPVFSPST